MRGRATVHVRVHRRNPAGDYAQQLPDRGAGSVPVFPAMGRPGLRAPVPMPLGRSGRIMLGRCIRNPGHIITAVVTRRR